MKSPANTPVPEQYACDAAHEIRRLSISEWGERKATSIIGRHPSIEEALDRTVRFSATESPVLITGETGTGKELFARALYLTSTHHRRVFLTINCAQYCGNELVASELFGHRKGAFTGAAADHRGVFEEGDGGTVFLDEIGDLPLPAQAMLLRTLGEGEVVPVGGNRPKQVNVRVIAATSRDLRPMIEQGRFRSDLFFRLRQLHVQVPSVRDRGSDWELIASFYLSQMRRHGADRRFSPNAVRTLRQHLWPGNVREVKSVVETGYHLARSAEIGLEDFGEALESVVRDHEVERAVGVLARECCARIVAGEESFWDAIHRPFLDRDLSRQEVRSVVSEGLRLAGGSYKRMLDVFGMDGGEYLKLMDFLRHHRLKPESPALQGLA